MGLPTELLAMIAGFTTHRALCSLSRVSRAAYSVSIKPLYASIPALGGQRTVQCVHTLASNSHLARLVQKYSAYSPDNAHEYNHSFSLLITYALHNMSNITELSLHLGVISTSAIFKSVTFKLIKLSQPTIESLYLVCRPSGLSTLPSIALPALQDVAAPLCLLPYFMSGRVKSLERVACLGGLSSSPEIRRFSHIFRKARMNKTATPLTITLGLDLTSEATRENLGAELMILGYYAPWIQFLRLEIHDGPIEQKLLSVSLTVALAKFPNLRVLALISEHPTPTSNRAYIQQNILHDPTEHVPHLYAWRMACPTLERVIFPIGVYKYVKNDDAEEEEEEEEGWLGCKEPSCEICLETFEKEGSWNRVLRSDLHGEA